jgi:putative Holliday junction resolvase
VETKEVLGLDVGGKQTGIARASNVARLAEPLRTVPTKDAIDILKKYIGEYQVEAIAVGLPRNLKGEDTKQTLWVREWADKAKQDLGAPLYLQDEALTSIQARLKGSELNNKADEHSLSAAIILQDFLDSAETDRMVA